MDSSTTVIDDHELEKKLLETITEHGGTISNRELTELYANYLQPDAPHDQRRKFQDVLGHVASRGKQGKSTMFALKPKYRDKSNADGLQSSIWKALSSAHSSAADVVPASARISDDRTQVTGNKDCRKTEESDAGVSVVLVNDDEEEKDESLERISDPSSLAKMLVPLSGATVDAAVNIHQAVDKRASDEEEPKINTVLLTDHDAEQLPSPLAMGDSESVETQVKVHGSSSEPDLFRVPTPESTVHHSASDQDMVAHGTNQRSIQHKFSVKDRALLYEKEQDSSSTSKGSAAGRSALQRLSVASSKSGKIGKQKDDGSDTYSMAFVSLSEVERSWLLASSSVDYHEMCKLLLQHPELAQLINFINGYTALHWAAKKGHLDAIKLLAGAHRTDVNAKTGFAPLHLAAMHNHEDAMELLINTYGANPRLVDHSGRVPDRYLNNTYGTRRVNANEMIQGKGIPSTISRSYDNWHLYGRPLNNVPFGGGIDASRPGANATGFARIGSIRRAGAVAMNLLRGQQAATRLSNGSALLQLE